MAVHPDERGRRAPTPTALASLDTVPDGYRILPDPLLGQPLIRVPVRSADVRLLLDRSRESAQAGEPSQDYLALRCDQQQLSFAVTDGVGSSFLGDVAAQILAAQLADWLAVAGAAHTSDPFDVALTEFLHRLSREVGDRVARWPIPESVSGLVRAALNQQRTYGSEAMLACGVVDLAGGRAAMATVAWLGDTHLRLIMRDGQQANHSGQTTHRWSSRLGPRGEVHVRTWPVAEIARVIACTDGLLPELDATVLLPDDQLDARLRALAQRPGNDDIALVDIGLTPHAMPPAETAAGSALWRRLTDEPTGRHARTTPAGSALRRLMRAVAPAAASAPQPAAVREPAAVKEPIMENRPAPVEPPADVRCRHSERGREVSWSAVADADAYAVQVCREPSFTEPLLYTVRGLSFAVPPLPGPLFLRLRCLVAGEPGPWGGVYALSAPRTSEGPPPATGAS